MTAVRKMKKMVKKKPTGIFHPSSCDQGNRKLFFGWSQVTAIYCPPSKAYGPGRMLTARARKALKGCSSNLHKRHKINFFGQIFQYLSDINSCQNTHTLTHSLPPRFLFIFCLVLFYLFYFPECDTQVGVEIKKLFSGQVSYWWELAGGRWMSHIGLAERPLPTLS